MKEFELYYTAFGKVLKLYKTYSHDELKKFQLTSKRMIKNFHRMIMKF